jgi:hypothetical protein
LTTGSCSPTSAPACTPGVITAPVTHSSTRAGTAREEHREQSHGSAPNHGFGSHIGLHLDDRSERQARGAVAGRSW